MLVSKDLKDIQYTNSGIAKVMNEDKALWEKKSTVKVNIEIKYTTDGIYRSEVSLGGEKYKLEHTDIRNISSQSLELDLNKVSLDIKVYSYTSVVNLEYCYVYFRTSRGAGVNKWIDLKWDGFYSGKEGEIDFNISEIKPELQAGDVLTVQVEFPKAHYRED